MRQILVCLAFLLMYGTLPAATVTFDGATTYQVIDGFGVNANHRSWNNDELKPVLDALIDQAGMTLFRVVYDDSNWEASNDNADPNAMNWGYYAPVYQSAEFTKLWNLAAYLNSKGITTNGLIFNFMGPGPAWLGGGSLTAGLENEWAEMITSLLLWARYTNGLQFTYVGPDNEPDISNEGISITSASQYVMALRALAQKLDVNGLSDLRLVGPDLAGGGTTYMPELLADPVVMGKLAHFGLHSYSAGGGGSAGVYDYLHSSAYPDRTFWMTEFNVWCSTCDAGTRGTYDWAYCQGTANYLLSHLANGASGATVWEGYDSFYVHPPSAWSFWGLFSVDDENAPAKTYTPRKNFYTMAQVSKFVRPGAQRIRVSGAPSALSPLLAFKHSGLGQVTMVGINTSGGAVSFSGSLGSLPTVAALELYYTSASANLAYGGSVKVSSGAFSATIPPNCVFTLTGYSGVRVSLTNPPAGASFNAPATIPIAASAVTSTGSIAKVEFFQGSTKIGDSTNVPYGFTWTNVSMGDYSIAAFATDTSGNLGTSAVVRVTVVGPMAQLKVTPASAAVAAGGTQQFIAAARDSLGHAIDPQSVVSWSVSGGGTINSTGLFAAGTTVGAPYSIVATSGGLTGFAGLSVVAPGVTFGNTNEGMLTDAMWNGGAWINASSFQASTNLTVATIHAKVVAVLGRYQCAIYADSGGSPSNLLRGTAEVADSADGWNVFTLTPPLALSAGQSYWLAIWSDDANAQAYYSDNGGPVCWGQYDYGSWPDPIATTGRGSSGYCIFASGPAPAPAPPIIALQPQSQVVNLGSNATFAVSVAGDLPLSYQWYFNSTNALAGSTNNYLLLAHIGNEDAGWYSVSMSNAAGVLVSSNAQLAVNHPPVPASPMLPRYWGAGIKAPESLFLGTDPDGDNLVLSSVAPVSVRGAAVDSAGGWVYYTPPAGLTNDDAFGYTVGDGRGGYSIGTASVVVLTNLGPSLKAAWENGGPGAIRLVGSGIPYRSYTVEFVERLGAVWQPIGAVMSDQLGVFTYLDAQSLSRTNRFYRVNAD